MASKHPAIIWRFLAHHDQIGIPLRQHFRREAEENRCFTYNQILADWPIVFALWGEDSRPAGLGILCVKGYTYGCSLQSEARHANSTALWCDGAQEAIALMQ